MQDGITKCSYCGIELNKTASVRFVIKIGNEEMEFCTGIDLASYDIIVRHNETMPYGAKIADLH